MIFKVDSPHIFQVADAASVNSRNEFVAIELIADRTLGLSGVGSSDAGSSEVENGKNKDANFFGERDLHRLIAPVSDMGMFGQMT